MDHFAFNLQHVARSTGLSILASVVVGLIGAFTIGQGIDINITADVETTATNMLEAEQALRAKAYLGGLMFCIEAIISAGLFLLARRYNMFLALGCLIVHVSASGLMGLGAMFAMNAAHVAGNAAYATLGQDTQLLLASLQATSDYTSFHLGLVLTAVGKAGFFYLFLRSGLIPRLIAGWGVFASLFVGTTVVARDFVPFLGHGAVTTAFMASNLVAILALGLYLTLRSGEAKYDIRNEAQEAV